MTTTQLAYLAVILKERAEERLDKAVVLQEHNKPGHEANYTAAIVLQELGKAIEQLLKS